MTVSRLLAVAGLPRVGEGRHYVMGEPFANILRLIEGLRPAPLPP